MVILNGKLYLGYNDESGQPELLKWFNDLGLKNGIRRGSLKSIPHPRDERKVLIDYDSIPEATRLKRNIPSREEIIKANSEQGLSKLITFNGEAYNYFLQNPATTKRAKEKAEQASWLLAIASQKTNQVKALGFLGKDEFYLSVIRGMNERKWQGFKVSGLSGLRKRLAPFQQHVKGALTLAQACSSMVSKKTGNNNAGKIDFDQQALLVQLYSDPNAKPNFEQVWMIYTRKAQEMIALGNWEADKIISPSGVRAFLTKPAIRQVWYEARHGYQEYRNVFEPVTQRERPSFANALWVIDGTPSHRYFQHGDKGRYFRFNIFPILDAATWCVLGFWLSETENADAVLGGLRSACWVSGHMPHQILYDNSSAIQSFRAQEAIDKISVVAFAATAGNARSKIIENFFHRFNEDVQKFRPGYTANPFAIRLDNRPNREALARMVKSEQLPLAEHAISQAIEDLTIWNNTPRKFLGNVSPITAYRDSVEATKSKQRVFTETIDQEAFWTLPGEHKKIRTYEEGRQKIVNTFVPTVYTITNRGIDITINGIKRTYDLDQSDFHANFIGASVTVRYEPNPDRWIDGQPAKLLLYSNGVPLMWKGVHLCLEPVEKYHMAVVDYRQGERKELQAHLNRKKEQRSIVQKNFSEIIEHAKRTKVYTPVITSNAFDKEVLSDTKADLLNQFVSGEDYRLTQLPPSASGESPHPKANRLDKYDKPLPLT